MESISVVKAAETKNGLTKDHFYVCVVPKANTAEESLISFKVTSGNISSDTTAKFKTYAEKRVKSINITPFAANDVLKGKTTKTEVIIYNAQGENITKYAQSTEEVGKVKVTADSQAKSIVDSASFAYNSTDKKGYLTVTGKAVGTAKVYVTSEAVSETIEVTVGDPAIIKSASFGSTVQVINNDKKVIAGDKTRARFENEGFYYTLITPVFKDQYGHTTELTAETFGKLFQDDINALKVTEGSDFLPENVKVKLFTTTTQGAIKEATGDDTVKYVGISVQYAGETPETKATKSPTRVIGKVTSAFDNSTFVSVRQSENALFPISSTFPPKSTVFNE